VKFKVISLLAVTALALTACSGHHSHPAASGPSVSSSTPTPAASPVVLPTRVVATKPSLGAGLPLLTGFGDVWSASGQGLVRFTLDGKAETFLGKSVRDIALSPRAVVVLLDQVPQMLTFDPATLRVSRQWALPGPGVSVTADGNVAYVVDGSAPARITRVDLSSGAMTTRVVPGSEAPAGDRSIAVGGGSLWFVTQSHVYQLNPRVLTTVRSIASPISPSSVWFGDGAVWVSSENPGGGVLRLDPRTAAITTTVGTDAIQIAFTPQWVWLAAAAGATALRPSTGGLVGTVPNSDVLDDSSAGIAVVGSTLWVAYGNQSIIQILQVSPS
jgi:hypothetical protein